MVTRTLFWSTKLFDFAIDSRTIGGKWYFLVFLLTISAQLIFSQRVSVLAWVTLLLSNFLEVSCLFWVLSTGPFGVLFLALLSAHPAFCSRVISIFRASALPAAGLATLWQTILQIPLFSELSVCSPFCLYVCSSLHTLLCLSISTRCSFERLHWWMHLFPYNS